MAPRLPVRLRSSTTCPTNVFSVYDDPIPLMIGGTLSQTPLSVDFQAVTIDRSAPVMFEPVLSPGSYDVLIYSLDEVVNSSGFTTLQHVRTFLAGTTLAIEPSLLVKHHTYVIMLKIQRGYPDSAMLDYRAIAFPFDTSRAATHVFKLAD